MGTITRGMAILAAAALAGCVNGRNYSIADNASAPAASAAEASARESAGDPDFQRIVYRQGASGLEVETGITAQTGVSLSLANRYITGNLVPAGLNANLNVALNGGASAGVTAAVAPVTMESAIAGGGISSAGSLAVATTSTQSVHVAPGPTVGGGTVTGGSSTSFPVVSPSYPVGSTTPTGGTVVGAMGSNPVQVAPSGITGGGPSVLQPAPVNSHVVVATPVLTLPR